MPDAATFGTSSPVAFFAFCAPSPPGPCAPCAPPAPPAPPGPPAPAPVSLASLRWPTELGGTEAYAIALRVDLPGSMERLSPVLAAAADELPGLLNSCCTGPPRNVFLVSCYGAIAANLDSDRRDRCRACAGV